METGIPAAAVCTIPANVISRSIGSNSAGENQSPGKSLPRHGRASRLEKHGFQSVDMTQKKQRRLDINSSLVICQGLHLFRVIAVTQKKPQRSKLDGTRSAIWHLHAGHLPRSLEATHGHHFGKSVREQHPDFYQRV